MNMEKLTLNVSEAAELLGVSVPVMYQLTRRSDFPTLKIGKRTLIVRERLTDWVNAQINSEAGKAV